MKTAEEKTPEEIEIAYKAARKIASSFAHKVNLAVNRPHLTFEDLVQEAICGWLQGCDMYYAVVEAYRKDSPISRWARENGQTEPTIVPFSELSTRDDQCDAMRQVEIQVDSSKIIDRIQQIKDENKQFAVLAYLYFGMSLRQIADVLGCWQETVRRMITPEIEKLKEEFK